MEAGAGFEPTTASGQGELLCAEESILLACSPQKAIMEALGDYYNYIDNLVETVATATAISRVAVCLTSPEQSA